MSLLTQAIAGAMGGAADMGSALMLKQFDANLKEERAKADAMRNENLVRLRNQLETSPEAIAARKTAEQGATISPYTVDNMPATYNEVKSAGANNADADTKISGLLSTAASRNDTTGDNGPPPNNSPAARTGNQTPEEQAQISNLNKQKKNISYTPEVMMQNKLDMQQQLSENKMESMKQVAEIRAQAVLSNAETKYQAAIAVANIKALDKGTGEYKQAIIDVKTADNQRKAAADAMKLYNDTGGRMDAEQAKQYNNFMKMAGDDSSPIEPTVPPAKAAKKKEKGMLSSAWDAITGGSEEPAAPTPAPVAKTKGVYDYSKLPPDSQPIPGKFTKDGRPVFKTPQGQLIAPTLQ